MPLTKVVTKCKTVGRCGTGAVKAIVLHEIRSDINSYLADARNCCDRGCQSSLHYVVDGVGCRPYQFVPEADTAWGFSWTPPTTGGFCNPCPPDLTGCDPCSVPTTDPIFAGEVGDLALLDPNCFVIHVGVLMPVNQVEGIPQTSPCGDQNLDTCPTPSRLSECAYDELVKLLCDIYSHFPALPKNATTLRKFGCDLSDIDIIQLLADIQVCIPAPPPFNRLCHDLNLFPVGVPVNVFGADASGACVKGPIGGGAFNLCAALALLPVGAPGVPGVTTFVGADCQVHTLPAAGLFDLCAGLAALPLGATAIPGTTVLIGDDCQRHLLPVSPTSFLYVGPPLLVHTITHNLGTITPQLTFFDDTTNTLIVPSNVVPTSLNTITATFFSPQAIRAIVSRMI